MRLLFAGTPETAVPSLEALIASRHEVVAVLTRADAPAGRGRKLVPSPVRVAAEAAGIPVITDVPRGEEFLARLRELDIDAAPVVAYGHILKPEVLAIPAKGWVNLHFSVLPAWRGAAPVQRAIIAGDEITGATTFLIDEGMDTGPVLGTLTETVRPRDTSGDLLDRLAHAGAGLLVATMDALEEGSLNPQPQPGDGVSMAAKLTTADAHIDFRDPALAVDRLIRGCTPAPGAWTTLPGHDGEPTRLGLGPVTVRPDVVDLLPGEVSATKREVLVGTATHAVELGEVRPVGKKPMPAADWARGARLEPGLILGIASDDDPRAAANAAEAPSAEASNALVADLLTAESVFTAALSDDVDGIADAQADAGAAAAAELRAEPAATSDEPASASDEGQIAAAADETADEPAVDAVSAEADALAPVASEGEASRAVVVDEQR